MRRTSLIVFSGFWILALEARAAWPISYPISDQLGARLEQPFKTLVETCGLPNGLPKRTNTPDLLRTSNLVKLDGFVVPFEGPSGKVVFQTVATTNNIWSFADKLGSPEKTLALEVGQLPSPRPNEDSSNVHAKFDCQSIIGAALAADVTVPFQKVEAAIKLQGKNERKSAVVVLMGNFDSPFAVALSGRNGPAARTSTLLSIWDHYEAHAELRNKPLYIIDWFTGAMLLTAESAEKSMEFDLKAAIDLKFPIANVTASSSNLVRQATTLEANNYAVYVAKRQGTLEPIATFRTLPTIAGIVADIAKTTSLLRAPTDVILPQQEYLHEVLLSGVPPSKCSNFEAKDNPSVKILPGASTYENGACVIRLTFGPSTNLGTDPNSFDLKYRLVLKQPIDNSEIAFPIQKTLTKGTDLTIEPPHHVLAARVTDSGTGKEHSWTTTLSIQDSLRRLQQVHVRTTTPIDCGKPQIGTLVGTIVKDSNHSATLRISAQFDGEAAADTTVCYVKVDYDLVLASGARVAQVLQTQVYWPRQAAPRPLSTQ